MQPTKTGKITSNLYVFKTGTVNFYIYKKGQDMIGIDSGYGKRAIIQELNKESLDARRVSHLFLTHSDFDHTGGISLFENAQIYLSADEEKMIVERKVRMLGSIHNQPIKQPHRLLNDNDIITAGAIQVRAIITPGHTCGSMSYLVDDAILFVGDSFKLNNNKVVPKKSFINMDKEQLKDSIRKLACLNHVQLACTAHSGYTQDFYKAILDWKNN
jgi:hydroxyacylglutathione hydrolase